MNIKNFIIFYLLDRYTKDHRSAANKNYIEGPGKVYLEPNRKVNYDKSFENDWSGATKTFEKVRVIQWSKN